MKTKNVLMKTTEQADMTDAEKRRKEKALEFVEEDFWWMQEDLCELEKHSENFMKLVEEYDPLKKDRMESLLDMIVQLFNDMYVLILKDERSQRQERRMWLMNYLMGVKLLYLIFGIEDLQSKMRFSNDEEASKELVLMQIAAKSAMEYTGTQGVEAALEITLNYQIMNYDY